jgi:hypothetical protein
MLHVSLVYVGNMCVLLKTHDLDSTMILALCSIRAVLFFFLWVWRLLK